jgi:hypothetical protein
MNREVIVSGWKNLNQQKLTDPATTAEHARLLAAVDGARHERNALGFGQDIPRTPETAVRYSEACKAVIRAEQKLKEFIDSLLE